MNGAILGMKKREIDLKLDEIIDFSGVEQFIDTPVKRYSSGMYVRLAFAVAAHLDPEILVIDEVLAVGDAEFQKKCLGKMNDVSKKEGRTVLFVSHNMGAVQNLCGRAITISHGKILFDGITSETIQKYSQELRKTKIDDTTSICDEKHRRGSGHIRITSVAVRNDHEADPYEFSMGDTVRFAVSWKCFKEMAGIAVYIAFKSPMTNELITSVRHVATQKSCDPNEMGSAEIEIPEISLRPGEYPLYIHVSEAALDSRKYDVLDDVTAPLVITAGDRDTFDNADLTRSIGFFSIRSKLR
jgi:lipopolysaccharide transport system ATP-binding protein